MTLSCIIHLIEPSSVFPNRVVLSKICTSKTVTRGCRQPIQMVASTFMTRRGCVCHSSRKYLVIADSPSKRLFTDTDMHNKTMRDEIEDFYQYLQRLIQFEQLSIPSKNYDLVMDVMVTEDQRISWSYYYACHEERCLFWLETYDASYTLCEVFGVKSLAHVSALYCHVQSFQQHSLMWCAEHRLEALYWWV